MTYIRETKKTFEQAAQDLEAAVAANGFGLLHTYDFRQILTSKGFEFATECRVLEICNPRQAHDVLSLDITLNMVLPCRISIYQDKGKTCIGMVPPTGLLALISNNPTIALAAGTVEHAMQLIIDAAV